MHLETAGRVRTGLPFRAGASLTRDHHREMNYILMQEYTGMALLYGAGRDQIGAGPGLALLRNVLEKLCIFMT